MYANERRFILMFCAALVVMGTCVAAAQPQHGLDLERDALTQTVLIHPVIDASGDGMTLWTREHTYRPA